MAKIQHTTKVPFQRITGLPTGAQENLRRNFETVQAQLTLTGSLISWAAPSTLAAPTGYLDCDGTIYKRAAYPNLFAVIGTTWNTGGEGADEFRVPKFNDGRFMRGSTTSGGYAGSADAVVVSHGHDLQNHIHGINLNSGTESAWHFHGISHFHTASIGNTGWAGNGQHNGHYNHGGYASEAPEPGNFLAAAIPVNVDGTARSAPNGDNNSGNQNVLHIHNTTGNTGGPSPNATSTVGVSGTGANNPLYGNVRILIKT